MKHKKLLLASVISSLMVTGCGTDYDPLTDEVKATQRDVYAKMEDCVADWGDAALCMQMQQAQQNQQAQAARSGPVVVSTYPMFYGPEYAYGGNRVTYYNGREVAARSYTAAKSTPQLAPSSSFTTSRSTYASSRQAFSGRTSSGGKSAFGGTARGVSASSGSSFGG